MARSSSTPSFSVSFASISAIGVGELCAIEILDRGGDVSEHRETLVRHFGNATEHDDPLTLPTSDDGQDARTNRRNDRGVSGQHAEIAFHAGNVNLIDLAGEGELFRRNQIELEGGHDLSVLSAVTRGLTRGPIKRNFLRDGLPGQARQ